MEQKNLSIETMYLLRLIEKSTFEEFLEETTIYFADEKIRAQAIVKESIRTAISNSTYSLTSGYRTVASAFENSTFAKELHNLPWDRYLKVMYQNPILWGKTTMNQFRLRIIESSFGNTHKERLDKIASLLSEIWSQHEYEDGWLQVFWSAFFQGMEKTEDFQSHSVLFAGCIEIFNTFLKNDDEDIKNKVIKSYKFFLMGFASQTTRLMQTITSPNAMDTPLEEAYRLVDFHPYFLKLVLYPFSKKVTLSFVKKIRERLAMKLQKDNFLSWSMILEACKALHYTMMCQLHAVITLEDLLEHVRSIDAIARKLEQLKNEQVLFFKTDKCPFLEKYSKLEHQTFKNFYSEALKDYWHHVVMRIPITEENLDQIVELQSLFYKSDWNNQFENITQDNSKIVLLYIQKMNHAVKDKEWNQEVIFLYISKSDILAKAPIKEVIDLYHKHRSLSIYQSILERDSSELPIEWLQQKHLFQTVKSSFD